MEVKRPQLEGRRGETGRKSGIGLALNGVVLLVLAVTVMWVRDVSTASSGESADLRRQIEVASLATHAVRAEASARLQSVEEATRERISDLERRLAVSRQKHAALLKSRESF